MKSFCLALLVAGASAFAPAQQVCNPTVDHFRWGSRGWDRSSSGTIISTRERNTMAIQVLWLTIECYLTFCFLPSLVISSVGPAHFYGIECRGVLQVHSFLGPTREARWIHGWWYGIWPHALVSTVHTISFQSKQIAFSLVWIWLFFASYVDLIGTGLLLEWKCDNQYYFLCYLDNGKKKLLLNTRTLAHM